MTIELCPACGSSEIALSTEPYTFGGITDVIRCEVCCVVSRLLPLPGDITVNSFERDAPGARSGPYIETLNETIPYYDDEEMVQ